MKIIYKQKFSPRASQEGVSTLVITILLLVIISLIVLFSASVGFFEQRTATNDNRARLAEQTAETAINMAGEFIKSNRKKIISNVGDGWLSTTATGARWVSCAGVVDGDEIGNKPHPCLAESNSDRRDELWFYTTDGTSASMAKTRLLPVTAVGDVGGAAAFPSEVDVQALLCRIDSSLTTPECRQSPASGNRIAVTFISRARLTTENSEAVVKETWASFTDKSFSSAAPMTASGFVDGVGNVTIVTAPNAGGYGVPVSIWAPKNVDVDCSAGGSCASVTTCQLGEYLKGIPESELKLDSGCAGNGTPCDCESAGDEMLSGNFKGIKLTEGIDILDLDGNNGKIPDLAFFPGEGLDRGDLNDDSLFEWVFGVDYEADSGGVTKQACAANTIDLTRPTNCAVFALEEFDAKPIATCDELNATSSGLYYVTGACNIKSQVGSPEQSVVVVVNESADTGNNPFYGLLFVRSDTNTAELRLNGGTKIFGSIVVQGDIDLSGSAQIVYQDVSTSADPFTFPDNAKFARLPGSWLDASEGF